MSTLFCFGMGYVAEHLSAAWRANGGEAFGTHRNSVAADNEFLFSENTLLDTDGLDALERAEAVFISIPPNDGMHADSVIRYYARVLAGMKNLRWIGYCSTTGVYGDAQCGWVDEMTPTHPKTTRSLNRLKAEEEWLGLFRQYRASVHIFRLSGIYGPGRSALERAQGGAPLIDKPGHFMNRIHVDDIVQALLRSIQLPTPGAIYNLSDDVPASSLEVQAYAYDLLGLEKPAVTPYEQAELSVMGQEFYSECKRVKGLKIQETLGFQLLYPDYKAGLQAVLDCIIK